MHMMEQAKTLLDAGELRAAVELLRGEAQSAPDDATRRTFLFELLCFMGEWGEAEAQLERLSRQSVQADLGAQALRLNIEAERRRARLFREGEPPKFLAEPPPHVALQLEAVNWMRAGMMGEARAALDGVEEARPTLSGEFNGARFSDFRDCDDITGPVLELFAGGEYVWLPFCQIQRLEVAPPRRLRDLLWASARVESAEAGVGEVSLPALYAPSSGHANELVKLGRMTEWSHLGEGIYAGVGLRLFAVDGEDRTVFEAGRVEFDLVLGDARAAS